MKAKDIHNRNPQELQMLLAQARAKLIQLGFDIADRKTKDTSQVKKTKLDIARILTALRKMPQVT